MTFDEWRGNKEATAWLRKLWESDNGQEFLRMLEESHVRHFQGPVDDAALQLGVIRGYDIAVNNIVKAAEYVKPVKEVPATYEKPEDK